jgi:hypothetical protein
MRRACAIWHSSLFDHYRPTRTDNSRHRLPLLPADVWRHLWPLALIEWSMPTCACGANSDDRQRPAAYPVSTGPGLKIGLISRFVRRRRRRLFDGRSRYSRMAGVQDDPFRPFARRLDPDDRSIDDLRPISEHRWRRWQTPADDEQQSRKHASDEAKIAGYGHRLSLRRIEQFRFVHDRDATPQVQRKDIEP